MNLPTIPHDKAMHFIYGLAIAIVANGVWLMAGMPASDMVGFLAAAVAGAGKEALDWGLNKLAVKRGQPAPHTVSAADAVATALGGVVLWLV